jgi:heat shock protein HslJ
MNKFLTILGCSALLLITSCKTSQEATSSLRIDMLTATTWQLTELNGKALATADFGNGAPTATFGTDHKVGGKGGCNTYGGSYNLNQEGGMTISQVFSTKMYCENAKGENAYLQVLEGVTTAKVEKDKLTLLKGVDPVLVFKPAK